jgi:hypothetical protein
MMMMMMIYTKATIFIVPTLPTAHLIHSIIDTSLTVPALVTQSSTPRIETTHGSTSCEEPPSIVTARSLT